MKKIKINSQSIIIILLSIIIILLCVLIWRSYTANTSHSIQENPIAEATIDSTDVEANEPSTKPSPSKPTTVPPLQKVTPKPKKETTEPPKQKPTPPKPTPKKEEPTPPQKDESQQSISERYFTPIEEPPLPSPTPRSDDNNSNTNHNTSTPTENPPQKVKSKQDCAVDINFTETGVVWVVICVNASGDVISAEAVTRTSQGEVSTITNRHQKQVAESCAKQYKYESRPDTEIACGEVPIYFRQQ